MNSVYEPAGILDYFWFPTFCRPVLVFALASFLAGPGRMSFLDYTPILKLVFVSIFLARFTAAFPLAHSPSLSPDLIEVDSAFVSENLVRPALLTRAIYCGKDQVTKWECEPCKAVGPNIHVIKWGGGECAQSLLHRADEIIIFYIDNNAVPNCEFPGKFST